MKLMILLVFLLISMNVQAAGIGVSPSELVFNIEKGKKQQREVMVYNLEDATVNVQVNSDSPYLEFYYNGVIEGQGNDLVVIEVDGTDLKEGNHSGTVYITAAGQGSGVLLSVGAAVKTRVNVFQTEKIDWRMGLLTTLAVFAGGMLLFLLIVKFSRRSLLTIKT